MLLESASNLMLPATSSVRSPELRAIVVPSIVMLSTTTPALAVTTPVSVDAPATDNPAAPAKIKSSAD